MKTVQDDACSIPKITVVTPSLNASAYVAETLRSVAAQNRTDVEQLIVDGGSSDGIRAIVAGFSHARFIDLPGSRQTEAMNYGAGQATGEFLVFLNADDVLTPGALTAMLAAFERNPEADVVYGRAEQIDEAGATIEAYPVRLFDAAALAESCILCQAGTMIRRTSFARAGGFTPALNFSMDYDLWLRIAPWAQFTYVDALVAQVRLHRAAKTVAQRSGVLRETFAVLSQRIGYVPYTWIYAYADHRLQPDDQVFDPRRASRWKVLYALAVAIAVNRRQPLRAIRDWLAHRS
jgi:glycosyltransferase involved in cell wall biosynthesis